MLFTVICVQVTAGIYWHNAVSLWSPIHGVEGVQTVGRKTFGRIIFWATDDWATTVISKKMFRRKRLGDKGMHHHHHHHHHFL